MAIDRGPWAALVDDDGSNLVGSVWNKAAIKTTLLDPIDAMVGNYVAVTATGAVNNLACGAACPITLISCGNAADLTITGLAFTTTPRNGDLVYIQARGAGVVYLPHNHANSTVRFSNTVTSGPIPLAFRGAATYVWNGTIWTLHQHEQGAWIRPVFSAAVYTGVGGTWTVDAGDQLEHAYRLNGTTLEWTVYITTSSITGTPSSLRCTLPNGFTVARQGLAPSMVGPAGVNEMGFIAWNVGAAVDVNRLTGIFAATTNTTYVFFTIMLPIT